MAKRKEYVEAADKAVHELTLAYYKEHGKFPDSYSVLKSALTRSYNNILSDVYNLKYEHMEKYGTELDRSEAFKQILGI
ncbi:thioredoxin [Escherichia phage PSD2002]|nr:thioredoxin [Escherichia phage PSD2002]